MISSLTTLDVVEIEGTEDYDICNFLESYNVDFLEAEIEFEFYRRERVPLSNMCKQII